MDGFAPLIPVKADVCPSVRVAPTTESVTPTRAPYLFQPLVD